MLIRFARVALPAAFLAASAQGGFFQLEVHPASQVLAGRVAVRVRYANLGDEGMRNVQPAIWFNGAWTDTPPCEALGPGEQRETQLDVGPTPSLPGAYTAAVVMRYTDRNGHPFTSLATIPVYTGVTPDRDPLQATLSSAMVPRGGGTITLTVQAMETRPLPISCQLLLPDEFAGEAAMQSTRATVPAKGIYARHYPVRNNWAVAGSQYRIYAIVDYVDQGVHGSVSVPGNLSVPMPAQLSLRGARELWILPGALAALYLVLQFRARRPTAS